MIVFPPASGLGKCYPLPTLLIIYTIVRRNWLVGQRGRSCRWIANRFRTPVRDERSYAAARHKIKVRCKGKDYGKILLVPSSLMRITAESRLSFTYLTISRSLGIRNYQFTSSARREGYGRVA